MFHTCFKNLPTLQLNERVEDKNCEHSLPSECTNDASVVGLYRFGGTSPVTTNNERVRQKRAFKLGYISKRREGRGRQSGVKTEIIFLVLSRNYATVQLLAFAQRLKH
jgi:hypothetical protein